MPAMVAPASCIYDSRSKTREVFHAAVWYAGLRSRSFSDSWKSTIAKDVSKGPRSRMTERPDIKTSCAEHELMNKDLDGRRTTTEQQPVIPRSFPKSILLFAFSDWLLRSSSPHSPRPLLSHVPERGDFSMPCASQHQHCHASEPPKESYNK